MSRPLRAEIRLSSLQHNLQRARAAAPHSQVMAAIKANAYGHGMTRVAHALHDVDAFAVASIEEAIILREAGVHADIILLEGMFSADEILLVQAYNVQLVIHSLQQVEWLEAARLPRPLVAWLKIDTGMHRLGINPADFAGFYQRLSECDAVAEIRFMSHFACADERHNPATAQQREAFDACLGETAGQRSLANSAAILAYPASHADWIRPGIKQSLPGHPGAERGVAGLTHADALFFFAKGNFRCRRLGDVMHPGREPQDLAAALGQRLKAFSSLQLARHHCGMRPRVPFGMIEAVMRAADHRARPRKMGRKRVGINRPLEDHGKPAVHQKDPVPG